MIIAHRLWRAMTNNLCLDLTRMCVRLKACPFKNPNPWRGDLEVLVAELIRDLWDIQDRALLVGRTQHPPKAMVIAVIVRYVWDKANVGAADAFPSRAQRCSLPTSAAWSIKAAATGTPWSGQGTINQETMRMAWTELGRVWRRNGQAAVHQSS